MQDKLPIAIVSDIACPWCFIGKARLETALARLGMTDRVAITWLPYELNPDMPAEAANGATANCIRAGRTADTTSDGDTDA